MSSAGIIRLKQGYSAMVIDREHKEQLRKEGFTSGAGEIKEKHIEKGKKDGQIEVLRRMLIESIENLFGEIDKKVREKLRFIYDKDLLRRMIILTFETKDIEDICNSIHEHLSDEDMYRREGYEHAINNSRGFYEEGRIEGLRNEKLSMILSIFKERFGHIEKEIEAAIMTRDLEERIDELFSMTFQIYNKQELIRYIKDTMTIANVFKAEGYFSVHKSFYLENLIYAFFGTLDDSIQNKIEKTRNVEELNALIEKVKKSECLEEFINELDHAVDRTVSHEKSFKDMTGLQLEHLLQE